ncbi:VWA domain-containing protein [Anaerolineales bacterium HSG24]|nr:VWA domain-containing protein [Anaerolineales bacterium HSG24]
MDFAEPTYFMYCIFPLLFLAGVVFLLHKHHNALIKRLGSPELINQLSATVNWSGRRWKNWLWFAALVMLMITLARPRWGVQSEYVERQGVEIMVALDISKSMLAEDLKPNRLDRAKLEISELMEVLIGNDLGLVLFSGAAFVQFPLTSDFTTARSFLDSAHPGIISRPGTAIAGAIEIGITGFNEERATQKVLLLLTDGENHEDDALGAANTAAEQGIIIYTIGFGSPEGEPIPEYDEHGTLLGYKENQDGERVLTYLDEMTLQDIALITGGRYFRATADGREVGFVADEIEKLQTSELESRFESRKVEQYQWFLAGAIIILLVVEVIPDRKHENVRRKYVKHAS